ncbi:MAG: alpha/beta fold hydrolase [Bacteroidota bacterium]|nr:alpha/beta fold hydrolase [Bacteroidota bacterium]MDP4232877.1 alpha/beta fold hydrolase [Bacteroidota bacterium]MDP4241921.1 alpha/beta fold hydrolase [Bacteroidota bacterium]MDP4286824.1 alpha/beta fold hydrolase [Bacteroidota bacterium]
MLEFRTVHGVRVAFEWVDSGKELIVFLHGVGADRRAWAPQMSFFSQLGYGVAAIDIRGSGDSQARTPNGRAVPISMPDFAADVDALIRELGFERAHWVGNSMGGVIIMEAFHAGYSTVEKAVLANTFAMHPESSSILPRPARALREKSLVAFAHERIPFAHKPDIDPKILNESILAMATKDVETYLASWRETWGYDYRETLSRVKIPTLVLTGSMDKITPPVLGEEIAGLISGSVYHMIEGANHLSNLDQPEEFNRLVYEFLKA